MEIKLINPCSEPLDKMISTSDGSYCNKCNKEVTDFSNMSDGEMLSYISKYGLGCGQFRTDQLERELQPIKTRKKLNIFYYLVFLIALFFKIPKASAQTKPDTVQPCKQTAYDKIEKQVADDPIAAIKDHPELTTETRRFGGAVMVCNRRQMVIKYYKRYSLFWGLIKFKIRTKQKHGAS